MVRVISDVRVARSFIGGGTPSTAETVELDFNLSTREAIRIYGITGLINRADGIAITVTDAARIWDQSLHLEEGATDNPNTAGASADQFENDHEIIYTQQLTVNLFGLAAGGGGMSHVLSPNGLVRFPVPILSVVNPTHRANLDEEEAGFELLIYYDYVELSDGEMALAFARRRR